MKTTNWIQNLTNRCRQGNARRVIRRRNRSGLFQSHQIDILEQRALLSSVTITFDSGTTSAEGHSEAGLTMSRTNEADDIGEQIQVWEQDTGGGGGGKDGGGGGDSGDQESENGGKDGGGTSGGGKNSGGGKDSGGSDSGGGKDGDGGGSSGSDSKDRSFRFNSSLSPVEFTRDDGGRFTLTGLDISTSKDGSVLTLVSSKGGTVSISGDGTHSISGAEWEGIESFTASASLSMDLDDISTIFMTNTPPVANDDSGSTSEDGSVTINVLTNDTDAEGDIVSENTVALSSPSAGTLTDNGNGSFTYDPNGAFESLSAGQSAEVSFDYQIEDANGETASATATITILGENDAPAIGSLSSDHTDVSTASANGQVTISGSFSDVDLADIHTATVDWGDGTVESLSVDQLADTLAGNHSYANGGVYTIAVTIDDGNGGTSVASTTAIVQGSGVVDGTLYVIGTDGKDVIHVHKHWWRDQLHVHAHLNVRSRDRQHIHQVFDGSGIDRIVIHARGGNDHAHVGGFFGGTNISASIFGGEGNDHLIGSLGDDFIDGGADNDYLSGGRGDDILTGGSGRDRIRGDHGNDLLIGGSVANESDPAALDTALSAWINGDLSTALLSLGATTDDEVRDDLQGGRGSNETIRGHRDRARR